MAVLSLPTVHWYLPVEKQNRGCMEKGVAPYFHGAFLFAEQFALGGNL